MVRYIYRYHQCKTPSSLAMAAAALCTLLLFLKISAFVFLVLASLVYSSSSVSFNLPNFGHGYSKSINLYGDAEFSNQAIQLTPFEASKAGRAMYLYKLHLWDKASGVLANFTTSFTFNINSDGNTSYGNGLAFFLANFSNPSDTSMTYGGGLGLMNVALPVVSSDRFVAVVFRTYTFKPLTNVSIQIGSTLAYVNSTEWLNDITMGVDNTALITYSASSQILQVKVTGTSGGNNWTQDLSYKIDLRGYLPEKVCFGFSAATGNFSEKHIVRSWQFNSSPHRSDTVQTVDPSPKPAVSTTQTLNPKEENNQKKGLVIAGWSIAVVVLLALLLAIYICCKKRRWAEKGDNNQITLGRSMNVDDTKSIIDDGAKDNTEVTFGRAMDGEFQKVGSGAKKFSYSELAAATNNFSEEQKLGEGGFGGVYSGFLRDLNLNVAVKRISKQSKQGVEEYASEVKIISQLRHRNLVPLHGWCHDKGELLLVYEYMPGGSLDFHLFKRNSRLTWSLRYKIAQGLASALSYLHEDWEQCVLHRDIKSSNVLLDSSFNARLGDFGLASLVNHETAPVKTYLGGTVGYVAPECHHTLKTSKESDVYSFGIVALEIASGRRSIFPNGPEGVQSLVNWIWDLYGMGKLLEAADPKLCENFVEQEMERLMVMGLWCAHPDNNSRPSITQVVHCLKFQSQLPILPRKMPKPVYAICSSAVSLSASNSSGTEPFDRQEFEYHTNSSRDNTRLTSSSVSGGSSTSASLPQIF